MILRQMISPEVELLAMFKKPTGKLYALLKRSLFVISWGHSWNLKSLLFSSSHVAHAKIIRRLYERHSNQLYVERLHPQPS